MKREGMNDEGIGIDEKGSGQGKCRF